MHASSDAQLVTVTADSEARATCDAAEALAAELRLPFAAGPGQVDTPMALTLTDDRLELRVLHGRPGIVGGHPLAIDLLSLDTVTGPGRSLRQPLLRAMGMRRGEPYRPRVLDATAGLGEDAWLLAAMGCHVSAVERHAVVAALLRDALRRAAAVKPDVAGRVRVIVDDSAARLRRLAEGGHTADDDDRPDVVYLDPMFPLGRKTAERKPMRILRWLVGDDPDAAALLAAARSAARRRVVVKRPSKAAPVGDQPVTCTHRGKSVRYDVYASG